MKLQATDKSSEALTVGTLKVIGGIGGQAFDSLRTAIDSTQKRVETISADLEDYFQQLSADGIIDVDEKEVLSREMSAIQTEYPIVIANATAAKIPEAEIDLYQSAYITLYSYITFQLKLFDNLSESTSIVFSSTTPFGLFAFGTRRFAEPGMYGRELFDQLFSGYYAARNTLQGLSAPVVDENPVDPDKAFMGLYLSGEDWIGNKVINNAMENSAAVSNNARQAAGINGNAMVLGYRHTVTLPPIPGTVSITISLFVRPSTWGHVLQRMDKTLFGSFKFGERMFSQGDGFIDLQFDRLTLHPDVGQEVSIARSFSLYSWYGITYRYDDVLKKESVSVTSWATDPDTKKITFDHEDVYPFNNSRYFGNTHYLVIGQSNINGFSGVVDEFRIDRIAWTSQELASWISTKGGTSRPFTAADYKLANLNDTIINATPTYLGAFDADPIFPKLGDWFAWSGSDTDTRKKGLVYLCVDSGVWVEDNNWAHIMAAMNDLLQITNDTVDAETPAVIFARLLMANAIISERFSTLQASIGQLDAMLANIETVFSRNITLTEGGAIQSSIFEPGITGFKIDADGKSEFISALLKSVIITGNSLFSGEIDSGPLFLSSAGAQGSYTTYPDGTAIETLFDYLTTQFTPSTAGPPGVTVRTFIINVVGSYGTKTDLRSIRVSKTTYTDDWRYNCSYNAYFGDGTFEEAHWYDNISVKQSLKYINFAIGSPGKTFKLRDMPTSSGSSGTVYKDANNFLKVSP